MRKKILIADDEVDILNMLQLMFEDSDYDIEVHGHGQAAQQIQEPYPDLMLLDILLSGMNGIAICQHLKSQKRTQHIPIILFSAHINGRQLARDAGADDFLAKPFEIEELLGLVEKHLS